MRTINIGTAAAPEDPYAQAQQQQAYADALTARAVGQPIAPLSSTGSAWEQGLSQLAQALLGARLHQISRGSVQDANAQLEAANQAKLDALAPNVPGKSTPVSTTLDAVNPNTPPSFQAPTAQQLAAAPGAGQGPVAPAPTDAPVTLTDNRETPQTLSPEHQMLSAALAGMDPRAASQFLSSQLATRALPAPQQPFTLSQGQTRYDADGNPIASVAPKPEADNLQHVEGGMTFDPKTGQTKDSTGRVLSSAEVEQNAIRDAAQKAVVTAKAQNQAKLDALPPGSIDYLAEQIRQGQTPQVGRNGGPALMAAYGKLAEEAKAAGDTTQAAVYQQGLARAAQPALKQNQATLQANQNFLATMDKNIQAADALEKQYGGAQSPLLNRAYQQWKTGVSGDPQTAPIITQMNVWNNSIRSEAAKLASGSVGSVSAPTDARFKDQENQLNSAQNYATWRAAANAMLQEGHNRVSGIMDTQANLQRQITGRPAAPAAITATGPGGKKVQLVNGQWVPM